MEAQQSRHADIAIRFAERWHEDPMLKSRADGAAFKTAEALMGKIQTLRSDDPEQFNKLLRVPNFFEELGIAEKLGWINKDWVRDAWGSTVAATWATWEPTVDYFRDPKDGSPARPKVYVEFQKFKDRVAQYVAEAQTAPGGAAQ